MTSPAIRAASPLGHGLASVMMAIAPSAQGDSSIQIIETGTEQLLVGISFLDVEKGFVVGGDREKETPAVLLRTLDGGQTWTAIDTGLKTRLYDICFPTPKQGWVCGLGGVLLHTTDGGLSWDLADAPFSEDDWLAAVWFVDQHVGFVVGQGEAGAVLSRTTDGGGTWEPLRSSVPEAALQAGLRDVVFLDAKTGFAAGTEGTLLRTTDGGDRWTRCETGVQAWLRSISFSDPGTGFVAGSRGTVLRTDDGGATWRTLGFPTKEKINSIAFPTASRGYAVTMEGNLWSTEDGGRTWNLIHGADGHLTMLDVSPGGTGWAACSDGKVLRFPPPR